MDFENNIPIYIQVIQDIKTNIVKKNIGLGDKLPSARDLALKYKINPNTASRIYKELEAEDVCFTKRGLGTYITEDKAILIKIKEEMAQSLLNNFVIGMKDLGFLKEELLELIVLNY